MTTDNNKEKKEDDPVQEVVRSLNSAVVDLESADGELSKDLDEIKEVASSDKSGESSGTGSTSQSDLSQNPILARSNVPAQQDQSSSENSNNNSNQQTDPSQQPVYQSPQEDNSSEN